MALSKSNLARYLRSLCDPFHYNPAEKQDQKGPSLNVLKMKEVQLTVLYEKKNVLQCKRTPERYNNLNTYVAKFGKICCFMIVSVSMNGGLSFVVLLPYSLRIFG